MHAIRNRPHEAAPAQTVAAARQSRSVTGLNVLVVEDDALIAALLSDVLEDLGHRVCAVAATQAEAVAAAARHAPDLMIVDARLAIGSGVLAVAEILRSGFVPHVFMSGGAVCEEGLDPRAVRLMKPFGEAELVRAIARALDTPGVKSIELPSS